MKLIAQHSTNQLYEVTLGKYIFGDRASVNRIYMKFPGKGYGFYTNYQTLGSRIWFVTDDNLVSYLHVIINDTLVNMILSDYKEDVDFAEIVIEAKIKEKYGI